jgi:DNA repair protein RadC
MDSDEKGYPGQPIGPVANDSEMPIKLVSRRPITDASEMSEAELLTVLLGQSAEAACQRMVAEHSNMRQLALAHRLGWREAGLSFGAIRRLEAVFEIARRYGETEWIAGEPFKGSYDVYAHYRERLAIEPVEVFLAIALDNRHRKLRDLVVGRGSLTASIVHPRDVYLPLIRASAAAVIFVHNHPSGDPMPSREDLEITRRLREVGELVGIRVLDHVVIGKGRYVSFVDDGYW